MTIDEAINILEDGDWWEELGELYIDVNSEYDRLYEAVDMAIAALKEKNARWISVEDRMPENEQKVLVCVERRYTHQGKTTKYRFVENAFHTDGKTYSEDSNYTWSDCCVDMDYDEEKDDYIVPEGWWESVEYVEESCAIYDFVTHWMPLPKLPEEVTP